MGKFDNVGGQNMCWYISYKKYELITLREYLGSLLVILVQSMLLMILTHMVLAFAITWRASSVVCRRLSVNFCFKD